MVPEKIAEALFIQLSDADTILVRRSVFGSDVHCQLCQVEISSDPGGGSDAGRIKHFPDHCHGKVVCGHIIVG